MLEQIEYRRKYVGLSVRALAKELGVSHTLLSLTLSGQRSASKTLARKFRAWLNKPIAVEPPNAPGTVYARFLAEKRSQLAPLTAKFYEAKLAPFIVWLEQRMVVSVHDVERHHVSGFLAHIRRGRRNRPSGRKSLSTGALKLHHQTIKTLFNYVGETCDVPIGWKNPVNGIKVKGSQSQTLEYSDLDIDRMFQAISSGDDELLKLRNRAILTVLLNTAVRASELLAMDVVNIGSNGRIKVIGKGSKIEL